MGRLLQRYGYRKTTVEDIAHEAGIGKGTVYLHFPSKEEVALCYLDRVNARLHDRLRAIAGGCGSAKDKLREMLLVRVMVRFDSAADHHASVDDMLAALRPAMFTRRELNHADEAAIFAEVLAQGVESGEFAIGDPRPAGQTILLMTNSLLPYSLTPQQLGERDEVERKARQIAELLLAGLLAR
jgi:AcrR family transcriptional regulator